jgi:hypothetical protein
MKLDLQGSAFCPERERTACRGDGLLASGATETHCVLMNLASDDAEGQARLTAFAQGLQQFG